MADEASLIADRTTPVDGTLRRTDGMWSRPVGDRAVLYSWDEGKAIVLNPTGAVLWEALKSPQTPSGLCNILIGRFPGLPADRARADVAAFVDRLLSESVLQSDP